MLNPNNTDNIIVGRLQECRWCGQPIRLVYLVPRNVYWAVEPPADAHTGRLVSHDCPAGGESR